jgi:beta-galactosidase/beta-glucuronidase
MYGHMNVKFVNTVIFSYFNVTLVPVLFLRQYCTSHFRNYSPALLEKHKDSLSQLIRRDKNRPSVIFWSIANEARTHLSDADSYFR